MPFCNDAQSSNLIHISRRGRRNFSLTLSYQQNRRVFSKRIESSAASIAFSDRRRPIKMG